MRRSSVRFRPPALLSLDRAAHSCPRRGVPLLLTTSPCRIATMRSHRSPARLTKLASVLGATVLWLTGMTEVALAQQSLNPTVTPVKDTGGWVYWMAEGAIVIGGIILLVAGASYLRFAPRFSRGEEDEQVPRAGVRAPEPELNLETVWTQSSPAAVEPVPAPSATPAPQPAAVGAPTGAAAPAPAATAPAAQAAPA